MLDLIVLNAANCASGQCPQQAVVIQQPVVAVAQSVPGKTVVKYRRNLFGKHIPVQVQVSSEVVSASSSSCSKGRCK
jgi:hypothetical protein